MLCVDFALIAMIETTFHNILWQVIKMEHTNVGLRSCCGTRTVESIKWRSSRKQLATQVGA